MDEKNDYIQLPPMRKDTSADGSVWITVREFK